MPKGSWYKHSTGLAWIFLPAHWFDPHGNLNPVPGEEFLAAVRYAKAVNGA